MSMEAKRLKIGAIALVFFALVATSIAAQKAGKPAASKPTYPTANASRVLSALNSLGTLGDVVWKFHAGDIPHGEATDLNESTWQIVKTGFKTTGDACWFRTTVVIPQENHGYEITGSKLWLQFVVNSKPMPEIMYINGRRVALGEDLEPIVLADEAKPGEKFQIAVKVLAMNDEKTFSQGMIRIVPPASRPDPVQLREEALTALTMLPGTPGYKADMSSAVNDIVLGLNMDALRNGKQAEFDASVRKAHEELMKFRPALQQVTVDMVGNSHIDAAWRWPESETIDVVKRTFGTALQLMTEYPNYKFAQSAAVYNYWIAEKYPAINRDIKKRLAEGRWEMVGGMWVEPDLNMPDGESIVRQLLTGKRYFKKEYGVDIKIGWNPDTFGYTWQMPQIYKKSGIDYFVTQKMHWNDTNQLPLRLFWWESPDGSKVLTYFPTGYGHDNLKPSREAADFMPAQQNVPGTNEVMDLYGVSDHGGGPTRVTLDEGEAWIKPNTVTPNMRFSLPSEYFNDIQKTIAAGSPEWNYDSIAKGWTTPEVPQAGMIRIPTWKDELYLEYHRGVFTTQAMHKRYMRESEEALLDAEKYASFAWLKGKSYPTSEFEDSWRKVCFGQFHDLAAGSGIGVIYKDAADDYKHVFQQARDANGVSLPALFASVDTRTGGGVPVAVINPLAWGRSGSVEMDVQMPDAAKGVHVTDAKGKTLPSQVLFSDPSTNSYKLLVETKDMPALGYSVLHVLPGSVKGASDLRADGLTLENDRLRVVVDKKTGCVTSLIEKKSNFEIIAAGGCGNQLQAFKDLPTKYDAWNIDYGTYDHPMPIDTASSVKLIENGSMRAVIEVERTWQKSHFTQQIVLEAGSDHVDFDNTVDWREEHILLKAAFPLAATSAKATYDIPYGTIDRSTLRENTFEKAQFEVPAMRWADLGDGQHGVTLMNRTKYGYDAVGNLLRLTLLRSAIYPDPVADLGMQTFSYSVYPHGGDWKQALSMQHGYEYNYQLRAMQVGIHAGSESPERSISSTDQNNVVVTAVKKAEDRNAIVYRMFEWAGKAGDVKLRVPAGASYAVMSDMMENPESAHLRMEDDAVVIPVHPYEIVTVQVMYKPKAAE